MSSSPRRSPRDQRMISSSRRNHHISVPPRRLARTALVHMESSEGKTSMLIRTSAVNHQVIFMTVGDHLGTLLRNHPVKPPCFGTSRPLKLLATLFIKRPEYHFMPTPPLNPNLPDYFNPSRFSISNVHPHFINSPCRVGSRASLLRFHQFIHGYFRDKLFERGYQIHTVELKRRFDIFEECEGHIELILEQE
ncbi:predicted protein [Chaetoceros tenuissimus]|uniref:Uncharacterized protein n=1 Tax=Chaetoceros tenuissimus TaxID=426638 RepID=A0AAD3CL06_9STRA|nr:predicted protein [Chaetoceros tenuissimus]